MWNGSNTNSQMRNESSLLWNARDCKSQRSTECPGNLTVATPSNTATATDGDDATISQPKRRRVEVDEVSEKRLEIQRLEAEVERLKQTAVVWHQESVRMACQRVQLREEHAYICGKMEALNAREREIVEMDKKWSKILDQKGFARTKVSDNPTTVSMMESKGETWYRRRNLSKDCLVSINGGEDGAAVAAFGVMVDLAPFEQIDKMMSSYKKGMYWQLKFNSLTKKYEASDEHLETSLAAKINGQLSRRKYQFQCKTLSSVFDPTKKVYVPRHSYIDGVKFRQPRLVSNSKLQAMTKAIDIGHIHPVPGHVGATRPLVSLVYMIVDLHLSVSHLVEELRWFKGKENHFIFCFADDGTPETKEASMSVGTLSCWNFNGRVRSSKYQYNLHIVNDSEKAPIFRELWGEHGFQMKLLEARPHTIAGKLCTFEFRAGGDESWVATALGETSASATYPSP
ncbi:Hypp2441 [Branchiostoma lanceolatum]|uniref:Hypp2441 protein n=1 Tax=Branchiostoma lanceolatum TaxID=7740 RepID=A0A8J9ZQQ8_BRALA|nr:Hypp2441 [Branchiostoma lanceolatum]